MAKAQMKQRVPIFVSSTYEDLIPYREEVQRVLTRLEQIVKGMEYFGSNPQKPLNVCLKNVRESKVFVCILGMRYGSIEEESQKSFSQLEYEEAVKYEIPTLIYIINEDHPIPPKYVDKGEHAKLLADFKQTLRKKHMVSFFTTPADLGEKLNSDLVDVLDSLDQIEMDHELKKNISGDFNEVFKKFMFRPAKYSSLEGVLTIKISDREKSCGSLKPDVVEALALGLGEVVSVPVYVIDKESEALLSSTFLYLYGEKECGDWIEQVTPRTVADVKIRLEYTITKEIVTYDNGSILKKVAYYNLILLEILSEK